MYFQEHPIEHCQPRAIRRDRPEAPQDNSDETVPGVHCDPTQDLTAFDQVWQTTADQPWSEDTVWSSIIPHPNIPHAAGGGFYSLPRLGDASSTFEHPPIAPAPIYHHPAPHSEQVTMHTFENVPVSSYPSLWPGMTAEQRSNVEWYARQVETGLEAGSSKPSNYTREGSSPRER
jgi:hypothetical protein